MAETGRHRLFRLPRRADKQSGTRGIPICVIASLAALAPAAQPEGWPNVGPDDANLAANGSHNRASYILGHRSALPSLTRGGSRMRESRTYGSVRGALSNGRPYRDNSSNP